MSITWPVKPELRRLYNRCLSKGMSIDFRYGARVTMTSNGGETIDLGADAGDGLIHFPDWREAVFGGRAATYIRHEKRLYIDFKGILEYEPYRADIHELGHAVWFLLMTGRQKYVEYFRLYGLGKAFMRLIPYGGEVPSVDESFAQDFEAFWTDDVPGDLSGKGAAWFAASAPTRFKWFSKLMRSLGAWG